MKAASNKIYFQDSDIDIHKNVDKYLNFLRTTDYSKISLAKLDNLLRTKLFCNYSITIKNEFDTECLFRARINDSNIPFSQKNEISITPEKKVENLGRCNLPGRSIFYSANDLNTCVAETVLSKYKSSPYKNISLTVGLWNTIEKCDLKLACFAFSDDICSIRGDFNAIRNIRKEEHQKLSLYNNWLKVQQFLSSEFSKKNIKSEFDYLVSAYLSFMIEEFFNRSLPKQAKVDGICYPAISSEYQGDNFAIFKKSFQNKFVLSDAYFIQGRIKTLIDNFDFNRHVKLIAQSVTNNRIEWW